MATSYLDDKSKYRANPYVPTWSGESPPEVDDFIGRKDPTYVTEVDTTTSGLKR
jgi:hypothetical protein